MFDTRFAVAGGVDLGSPRAFTLVSLMVIRMLRPIRLQLTSAGSPTRYCILTLG